jgi:hypothetical protein
MIGNEIKTITDNVPTINGMDEFPATLPEFSLCKFEMIGFVGDGIGCIPSDSVIRLVELREVSFGVGNGTRGNSGVSRIV